MHRSFIVQAKPLTRQQEFFFACVVFVRSCLSLIAHPFHPVLKRPRSSLHFTEHLPRESAVFLWELLETSQNTGFRAEHSAFALV